jgi:SWI/SNF-related matrix-associated actin-dependent regulator 1 of chromatin subfamily A
LLGDEMGVGKTIQALAVASIYIDDWPLLIISPKSLKLAWKEEILKWLPEMAAYINVMNTGQSKVLPGKKIHITSYEIATKLAP